MPSLLALKNRVNNTVNNAISQRPAVSNPFHHSGSGSISKNDSPRNSISNTSSNSPKATSTTDHQHHHVETQEDQQSLATLLNRDQRAELTVLISQTTEKMRRCLVAGFEEIPRAKLKLAASADGGKEGEEDEVADVKFSNLNVSEKQEENVSAQETTSEDQPVPEPEPDSIFTSATPETKALQTAALTFFDAWAESVILRVGEVVNSRSADEPSRQSTSSQQTPSSSSPPPLPKRQFTPTDREREVDDQLSKIYPPIPTVLSTLPAHERSTIINSLLLLLLSLESYRAHSRTLLVRLTLTLHISLAELTKMESTTAFGLLTAAAKMDASDSTAKAQEKSSSARKWKIGVAGVAGAALIGITGGLAAPLIAGMMGGLGLGALAGSSILIGGLFGAYGARMSSRSMGRYAKEIDDFAFLPTRGSEDDAEEIQRERRRLRITVGITGWLTEEDHVLSPWRVLGTGSEPFALRWELQALMELGAALKNFVVSQAWSKLRTEVIKRTIFAAVYSALAAPLMIRKAIKLVDSPFGNAKKLSVKAGEVLADALIDKVQGERPVCLVGQSLGARMVYSCLLTLAKRNAFGIVEDVVLMGAPVPSDPEQWRAMRSVISGRLINVYSEQDYILAFLYRTSSAQLSIAGLQDIEGIEGVENYDLSESVSGHLKYMHMTGTILKEVGWVDVDEDALKKEEMELRQLNEEEKELEEKGEDPEKADV